MRKMLSLIVISSNLFLLFALLNCGGGGDGGGGGSFYSVSGTISAADNSAIDSDVNDISTTPVSNDDFDLAQELPNPVILGGYVNTPGTGYVTDDGVIGHSHVNGDIDDYYSITLTEGQTITLYIADDDVADINLYLYDRPARTERTVSDGTDSTETITVPESGDYYVRVFAYYEASNYILVIGQASTTATVLDPRLEEDFRPGNVIVAFNDDVSQMNDGLKKPNRGAFGAMSHKSAILDHIQVYKFTSETADQVFQAMGIPPTESNRAIFQTADPEYQLKLDTLRVIDALNKDSRIRYAEPNYRRYPLYVPDDPRYSDQWHYPLINLEDAWDVTKGQGQSQDVIVAVIDTGILKNHPDIVGQLSADGGYDFISRTDTSNDGNGIDSDPEDPGDETNGTSSFHGTHVSGTVAAASDNGVGVVGVAYEAKIMPLRALGVGGGYTDDILECMKYAAGLDNASGGTPAQPADIINMSLGGGGYQQSTQDVINIITNEPYNVIVIAAAGNENTNTLSYPASYNGVISVSAVGPDKSLASYSNYGTEIDVAAPGGDFTGAGDCVLSTSGDDSGASIQPVYSFSCGTSMASPHMAGVVALMKAVQPDLTPTDLDALIANGLITEDLGSDGADVRNDSFGYGLIDAWQAVQEVDGQLPAFLQADPVSLNFGNELTGETELPVTLNKSNTEPIDVLSYTSSASWLTVTPASNVDGEGLGVYTARVDRSQVSTEGPYYATITFISTQNEVEVSVVMYLGLVSVAGDSGFHYVLLLDGNTFAAIYQDTVTASNGTYSYNFPSVAEGTYVVFAGTDSDNDYYVGDPGEARGFYISPSQSIYVNVNQNRIGINFDTAFEFSISVDELSTASGLVAGYGRLDSN